MIWLSVNFDVFMQNLLRLWYEKILLLTSVNLRGDYRNIRCAERHWLPGKPQLFYFMSAEGKKEVLFEVKAFKNSNTHLRLNQLFN
jgi:hypothetical protein